MVVLGGVGAVSYKRGNPVVRGGSQPEGVVTEQVYERQEDMARQAGGLHFRKSTP